MKAVVQRVREARVSVDGETVGEIGAGYLVLLGVAQGDTNACAEKLWRKLWGLRINEDNQGKTNVSLADTGGSVLVVSQFTLLADCRRGRRPSFAHAAEPGEAKRLYEHFCDLARADAGADRVATGRFAAHMQVSLTNDGPFTILLDTDELA